MLAGGLAEELIRWCFVRTDGVRATSPWRLLLPVLAITASSLCGLLLVRFGPASFDAPLLLGFRSSGDTGRIAGPQWIGAFWLGLTWLGDAVPRILVASGMVLALLALRRRHSAVFLAVIVLSGTVLSTALKHWVGRPRPQLVAHLDMVSSASFPSGHVLASTLFYATVALLLAAPLPQRAARWTLYAVAASLSLAIGVSRIALGVHWPTDVLAGWVIGGAWLWLWFALATRYWPEALRQAPGAV